MEADIKTAEDADNDTNSKDARTDPNALVEKSAHSNYSSSKASPTHVEDHKILRLTRQNKKWHNYKTAKQDDCLSCKQMREAEKRQALTRIKYCNKKAESLKTLINSVNKHQCNIVCNDVVKELVKRKVAVKLERVKLQHKIIAEKKCTAAGNESFTNDQVETIKKQYSGEKEENISEAPVVHYCSQQQNSFISNIACSDGSIECNSPPCDDDHWLKCMQCNTSYHGECPKHGVALHISSKDVDNKATDTTRARASLPDCLCLKESLIPGAGTGVFANIEIPGSVLFGPYAGDILLDDVIDSGYQWEIKSQKHISHYIDAEDEESASWLRFINCARTETEQNLIAVQYRSQIYYISYKTIYPGQELLIWYGNEFAKSLGLLEMDSKKPGNKKNARRICTECCRVFLSGTRLGHHINNGCIMRDNCQSCVEHLMDSNFLTLYAELLPTLEAFGGTINLAGLRSLKPACLVKNCPYLFTDLRSLELHLRNDHKIEKKFHSLSSQKHIYISHGDIALWRCHTCNRDLILEKNSLLLRNKQEHHEARCGKCDVGFQKLDSLEQDQAASQYLHFPFACFRCRRAFVNQAEAMDHVANKCKYRRKTTRSQNLGKSPSPRYYLCDYPFCGAQFKTKESRTKHFHNAHVINSTIKKLNAGQINKLIEKGPKVCNICDAEIFTKRAFLLHMRRVHGIRSTLHCPECQSLQKKNHYKTCLNKNRKSEAIECKHKSHHAQTYENGEDSFVNVQEEGKVTDSLDKALLGELQDMHVSSTEMDVQDKVVKPLIGISEFCLRGEIPNCDIDCQMAPGITDSSKLPINCNQEATDGTRHQFVDGKFAPFNHAQLSHGGGKKDVPESNIFNKLFSELLKDNFDEYDNGTEPPQTNTIVSNSHTQTSSEKSDYYAGNCTPVNNHSYPFVETDDFAGNQASEEQQNPDISIMKSVLSLPKREENQLSSILPTIDTPVLVHSNKLRLGVDDILESESCQGQSTEKPCLEPKDTKLGGTVQQDASPLVESHTAQRNVLAFPETGLDDNDVVSQSELWHDLLINEDNSHSATVCSSTVLDQNHSFKVISRVSLDTTDIDKNSDLDLSDLECGDIDSSFYRNEHSRANSPIDHFNDGSDELEKILEYQPVDILSSTKMDNFSADSKVTDTDDHTNASEVHCNTVQSDDSKLIEGIAPSQISSTRGLQTAGASTEIGLEESERPLSCTWDRSSKADAGNFVSSQSSIVKSGSNANMILEVSQTSSVKAKDFCDMNNNQIVACTTRSKQGCKMGDFKDKEIIHSNDSCAAESHDMDNSLLSQVPEDNSRVEDKIKNDGCQESCSEILKEAKYPLMQSKLTPSEEEITNVLPQESCHSEQACISQYDSRSTPPLDGNDCDSDIRPELEIDIMSAIQSYMAKNKETMEDHDSTDATNSDVCGKQDTQHVKVDISLTNPVADTSTSCATEVTKGNSYHKTMHVLQSSINNKMFANSLRGPSKDTDICSSVLYEDWMPEEPLSSVIVNQNQVGLTSELSIKNNNEPNDLAVSGNGIVDKPKKYLNKNASKLSSDQIRMQLKQQNGIHILPDKINPSPIPMPDRVDSARLSGCPTIVLSNNASAKDKPSYGKTSATNNTLIRNKGDVNLVLSPVTSVSTAPVYYSSLNRVVSAPNHDTSRKRIGKISPNKLICNDIIPLSGTIERDVPRWESLLIDCGSSLGNDTHLISSSQSKSLPIARTMNESNIEKHKNEKHRNEERKKLRRKQTVCSTVPQPLFEFHKLSGVATKKNTGNLGTEKKLSNTAIADQLGGKELDVGCCEGGRSLLRETVKPSKRDSSSELMSGDASVRETKNNEVLNKQELMASSCVVNKRKGVVSEISPKCKVMRKELSTESLTKVPKKSTTRTVSSKAISKSFRGKADLPFSSTVNSNSTVHLDDTSQSLSDYAPGNAKITPRFMRAKSHDVNLERKLEKSLLRAQKHIMPPEKWRTLDSDILKTICSTEYGNLFKSDLEVVSGESTVVDPDEAHFTDNEDEELERMISEKKAEYSRLLDHIRDVQTKIVCKSKNGLLKESLRVRKRYLFKGKSAVPTRGKRLLKKRFKSIDTNAARGLYTVIKNSKVYRKLDKFENKTLHVHLGKVGLQEASGKHIGRTWYCRNCSMNFKIRPCAVFLSRC